MAVFAILTALAALALTFDAWFLGGTVHGALPEYTATAISLLGLVLSGLRLGIIKKRKKKKKRSLALAMVWINLVACLTSTGFWLFRLTAHLLA